MLKLVEVDPILAQLNPNHVLYNPKEDLISIRYSTITTQPMVMEYNSLLDLHISISTELGLLHLLRKPGPLNLFR